MFDEKKTSGIYYKFAEKKSDVNKEKKINIEKEKEIKLNEIQRKLIVRLKFESTVSETRKFRTNKSTYFREQVENSLHDRNLIPFITSMFIYCGFQIKFIRALNESD